MLDAMRAVTWNDIGDSVYGEDPSENAFEAYMAELVGMEAGLFVVTGVMSNQIGLRVATHMASHKALFGEVLFPEGGHLGFR